MKEAKGTKGFILKSAIDGTMFFRVYHEGSGKDFVDYEIIAADVAVRIIDDSLVIKARDEDRPNSCPVLTEKPRVLYDIPRGSMYVYHTKEMK